MGHREYSGGTPALVEIDGSLHMLFPSNDKFRNIIDLVYDDGATDPNKAWRRGQGSMADQAKDGVAATADGATGYMAFLSNDSSQNIMMAKFENGRWGAANQIGELSAHTPGIAIFENQLFIAFVTKDEHHYLMAWQGTP